MTNVPDMIRKPDKVQNFCSKTEKRKKGGLENQVAGFIHEIIPVSTV